MAREANKPARNGKEPVFIIRPASRRLGLDYLHIALLALVIILIVLAFALSTFKQGIIVNNCAACSSNELHNSTQALGAAERYIAAYSTVNTSLALVPYYSLVNQSTVSYIPQSKEWLVVVPYMDPLLNGKVFNMSLLLYDSNLSLAGSFLQAIKPKITTRNNVVSLGTINLYNEVACKTSKPIPVYVVTDPYAPGAFDAIDSAINSSNNFKGSVNVSYFFVFTVYSINHYGGFGLNQTQNLGRYMECASRQQRFPQFMSNLSIAFNGNPLSNQTLYQVVEGSGLNTTGFGACMDNVSGYLNTQAEFARLYNITSTPDIIVNCRYQTLPQTLGYAINYSLSQIKG